MHPRPVPSDSVPPSMAAGPDFAEIFRTEFSYVWNALSRLGIPSSDLEDVAHDVFCRVYRQLPQFDATRPRRPWLFGFAFRVASDYRRQARHRVELVGIEVDRPATGKAADEELISAEERRLIEAALRLVPLDRRAILILHEIEGASVPTIAEALELPLNTAYSRLRLGRADLAAAVRQIQSEEKRHAR